jgi:hypothetical protein
MLFLLPQQRTCARYFGPLNVEFLFISLKEELRYLRRRRDMSSSKKDIKTGSGMSLTRNFIIFVWGLNMEKTCCLCHVTFLCTHIHIVYILFYAPRRQACPPPLLREGEEVGGCWETAGVVPCSRYGTLVFNFIGLRAVWARRYICCNPVGKFAPHPPGGGGGLTRGKGSIAHATSLTNRYNLLS